MDETWWKCWPNYALHILKMWSKNINHNPSYYRFKSCNVRGDNLSGTCLSGTCLSGTCLSGTCWFTILLYYDPYYIQTRAQYRNGITTFDIFRNFLYFPQLLATLSIFCNFPQYSRNFLHLITFSNFPHQKVGTFWDRELGHFEIVGPFWDYKFGRIEIVGAF